MEKILGYFKTSLSLSLVQSEWSVHVDVGDTGSLTICRGLAPLPVLLVMTAVQRS